MLPRVSTSTRMPGVSAVSSSSVGDFRAQVNSSNSNDSNNSNNNIVIIVIVVTIIKIVVIV